MRQFEKEKHVLEGNLKDIEWRLDSESQVSFFFNLHKGVLYKNRLSYIQYSEKFWR